MTSIFGQVSRYRFVTISYATFQSNATLWMDSGFKLMYHNQPLKEVYIISNDSICSSNL